MHTGVNACSCLWGCTDTVRESALKVDSGRNNPLLQRGIEPASVACLCDAVPTELHPHPSEPKFPTICCFCTQNHLTVVSVHTTLPLFQCPKPHFCVSIQYLTFVSVNKTFPHLFQYIKSSHLCFSIQNLPTFVSVH